ncbi:endolytic transglycosylase MltG [Candidatus Kaiserbacteria bacterium]|nr:endolytic transglycosylase MltG [Candidatus Kaiserbacteria bacterium]
MGEVIPEGVGPDIEKKWNAFQKVQADISKRWQKHANRRTAAIVLAIALPFAALYLTLLRAPNDFPAGDIITIERDATAKDIAAQFDSQHIIRSSRTFEVVIRLLGGDRSIHAGDYQFNHSRNVIRIAQALIAGDFGLEPVRIHIPAGATVQEMATIFDAKLIRFDRQEFIDNALPYEGYLYADTYFFLPTAKADVVIRTLRETFDQKIATIQPQIDTFGKPLHDVITMASMLEREENNYEDRQKIAGVLWKRIAINMPLQVDATFVYIIGKGSHQLTMEDLDYDSPYNTYKNKGLPPGPISNPSLDAIRAAVNPIPSNNLFYLADRNGTTHYSATYEEHLRKKRYYLGS